MKLTGDIKRRVLYREIMLVLSTFDPLTKPEVCFSKIMPTKRLFRADFFCPQLRLIVEVNGGQFVNGRHNRGGKGYENDMEKLNLAQSNGFTVLQFTYQMIERGEHIRTLHEFLKNRS